MGENPKPYDLEERTFQFAKEIRRFIKERPRTVANLEDMKQGSVGANYIEANESVSKKDFLLRI